MKILLERHGSTFKKAYVVLVLIALVWTLARSRMDLATAIDSLLTSGSIIYFLAWILMALLLGLLWKVWLCQAEGVLLQAGEWMPAQAMAWTGRYLPGKVGLLMGKLALIDKKRLGARALMLSVVVEQGAFLAAGACVALALFAPDRLNAFELVPSWVRGGWDVWMPSAVVLVVSSMAAMVFITSRVLGCARSLLKSVQASGLLVLHLAPHLLIGSAFYVLVSGAFPQASSLPFAHLVAVLALAHVAGAIAVFAPAGFGVREVVLAEGMRGVLSFDEALLLAAILRLLTLLADGTIMVVAMLAMRHWRGERP